MRRFGLNKDEEDSNRSSLFKRKKDKAQESNPYAQQGQQSDPYSAPPMTALQKKQAELGLPPGRSGYGGLPSRAGPSQSEQTQTPPPAYSSQASGGYSAGGYGASSGYGSNRYDSNNSYGGLDRAPTYRTTAGSEAAGPASGNSYGGATRLSARRGGYGGMGGGDEDDSANRQALFGSAPQKYEERQRENEAALKNASSGGYGQPSEDVANPYGGIGEQRELTAEEQEDEDVKRMNEETRYLRNETDQSLDRSLMVANQAIETAQGTLARMHNQRERLLNAEQNLDNASSHNKIAEHRTAELKHYNRSMFAVKVNNPFTSKQRAAERAQADLEERRTERAVREENRARMYQSGRTAEEDFTELDRTRDPNRRLGQSKGGISSKFALEDDDEEDIQKEQAIDMKIGLLGNAVGTLNMTAKHMNRFATEDLEHIDRITAKSDAVDDGVRRNQYKLNEISRKA